MPAPDLNWLDSEEFRASMRRIVEETALINGIRIENLDAIIAYMIARLAQFRPQIEEQERIRAVPRTMSDALNSVRRLVDATIQRARNQGRDSINADTVQDAYLAGFCGFWPFCASTS